MNYTLKGNLSGYICDQDCTEAIAGQLVRLYLPEERANITANAIADAKDTFRLVSPEEQQERQRLLIAEAKTDNEGNFTFKLDEKHASSAFDIDFVCADLPDVAAKAGSTAVQFHITTIYPQWRSDREQQGYYYVWQYAITAKWWCNIRGHYFDAWVICGKLVNCNTNEPLEGVTITAMDADLFTDDLLGTAVTDASGHFRINYTSADFRKNFIPLNLETDPEFPFLSSGPDVYFIADYKGTNLIRETAADRRRNVPYCLCVSLCSTANIIPPEGGNVTSVWTSIGLDFDVPTGPILHDFDTEGFAGSQKYGLTGVIRLTGQAPHKRANGNRVEYRFLVSHSTTVNGGPAPALASFTKIVGKTPGLLYAGAGDNRYKAGTMKQLVFPFNTLNVYPDEALDFDAEGWFDVNVAIERTLTAGGVAPADLNTWGYIDDDTLLAMNTAVLTTSPDVPANAADAGQPVPVPNRIGIEKIAIRFEAREVVNKATNSFVYLPGSGQTLNSVVINNNPAFMKCVVNELVTLGSCSPLGGTIHTAYTVHHPLLMSASIQVWNNSNSINKYLADGFITLGGNTNNTINHHNNASLQINASPNDLVRCTYGLQFNVLRRLHNGDNAVSTDHITTLFFYDI